MSLLASQVSPECQDLLCGLLKNDPADRLTLLQALAHPWLAANISPELLHLNIRLEVCDLELITATAMQSVLHVPDLHHLQGQCPAVALQADAT